MRRLTMVLVAAALGGCFATVGPDGQVQGGEAEFTLSLPVVLPPLIVVQPGVSVVRDFDHEVFYADGYYWARQDRGWYRSRDHRNGWARVDNGRVPTAMAQAQPGRYRHYRGEERQGGDPEHGQRDGNEGHR